ncbi:toxin Cry1Ac domain D-VI-related protein [Neobacillus sp.]|uniref:toxin Cry1Ac domain D-VI-related protein n=1 Tax=Neobacillus sp. TaxID=2675273 RepID=UPI0028A2A986|nr:toxin Cry1Ac domain D-VI-related protein [Neobacillus sp.]
MKKKKFWLVLLTAVIAIGVSSGFAYSQKVEAEKARIEVKQKEIETINRIQSKINKLFKDDQKEFLAEDITQDNFDVIQSSLKDQEGKEFEIENAGKLNTAIMDFGYAQNMFELQNLVNNLLDDKGAVVENATFDAVDKKVEELKDIKPKFVAEQQKIIDEEKQQVKQIKEATEKVNQMFASAEQKEIKSDVSRDGYNQVKEEINKIKQEKAKTDLSEALNKVDQYLLVREEAEKKAKEAQLTQSNKQTQSGNNVSTSSSNISGSSNKTTKNSSSSSKKNSSSLSNSGKNNGSSKSSWTPPADKPGTTWEGKTTDKGEMESDSGRTWGTIEW